MPLYFFDTYGPGGECLNDEGTTLLDLGAAQHYARRALCEIAGDYLKGGQVTFAVRVRDMTDAEVYRASIALTEPQPYGAVFLAGEQVHLMPDDDTVGPRL